MNRAVVKALWAMYSLLAALVEVCDSGRHPDLNDRLADVQAAISEAEGS